MAVARAHAAARQVLAFLFADATFQRSAVLGRRADVEVDVIVVGCGAHHGIKFAAQSSLSAAFNNQSSSCSEFPPLPVYGIALLF
jgi:hypothetical protein